jgi:hypothetical protein
LESGWEIRGAKFRRVESPLREVLFDREGLEGLSTLKSKEPEDTKMLTSMFDISNELVKANIKRLSTFLIGNSTSVNTNGLQLSHPSSFLDWLSKDTD